MSVEVIFETHSLTEDNERGIATGWLGGRLSENGKRLAKELGDRRRNENLAAIFTSDLARAVETTTIAFGDGDIPILKDWRLRECNYGAMNGMPVAQLVDERPLRIDTPFPEGESWRQAVERHEWFLNDLARRHDGERVLVIGHVSTWWALDHFVAGEKLEELVRNPHEWQEGWSYELPTGTAPGHCANPS
ncbi:MAG: histidine phosphatase family protein [Actinobacteria bacterium]|nr:histidine phosphatase family protein [Actinomycetota bacterium]